MYSTYNSSNKFITHFSREQSISDSMNNTGKHKVKYYLMLAQMLCCSEIKLLGGAVAMIL